jgi:hypothetical protein
MDYLTAFFEQPGGLIVLLDLFLTQFFFYPWIGALLLTGVALGITLITDYIFRKTGLNGILFSIIPFFMLAALHSHHSYTPGITPGLLLSLLFLALFIKMKRDASRLMTGIIVFMISYWLTGIFAFLFLALCILYEFFHRKSVYRYHLLITGLILALLIPYLAWRYIYLIELNQAWLLPVSVSPGEPVRIPLLMLALYYPLIIFLYFAVKTITGRKERRFTWKWQLLGPGILLSLFFVFLLLRFFYDRNNELFLSIDAHYQSSSWQKIIDLSNQYPGHNQLVMVYTNLALYKNGNMADRMFACKQSGNSGLWLEWKRNETAPFFGGEVFYQLGFINEAFRWAFEAMEAKGLNPRSLKRLVNTSIINGDYEIAGKYLNYLDQTLFYHAWAKEQRGLISDTASIALRQELMEKRKLLLKNDFIVDININNIGLDRLLTEHPDNRMAFEYMMASFLLTKNLDAFASNIYRLKGLGYKRIPQHYEEALVLYAGLIRKDVVPVGYTISSRTREQFHQYASTFAANRYSMDNAARALYGGFGNTFWYYMQFSDASRSQTPKKM